MNNGIFIQDIYGRVGWDGGLPRPLLGAPSVLPMPYHYPGGDWKVDLINNFVYVVDTRFSSIPAATLRTTNGGLVDWGDGIIERRTTSWATHIYATHGIYIIQLLVPIGNTEFGTGTSGAGVDPYARNIIKCLSYGNKITSLRAGFNGCTNFIEAPKVMTNLITKVFAIFGGCINFNQDLSNYDFSGLLDDPYVFGFQNMFSGSTKFNNGGSPDINKWNTNKVTSLNSTFLNSSFNQNIGNWDTSNVTNTTSTFQSNAVFNQDINNWNVRKVTTFQSMFQSATNFNGSLSGWAPGADTAGTNCTSMFQSANSFNQDIGSWDTSKVTNMASMFNQATNFNNNGSSGIGNWNTINVNTMQSMFQNAIAFNQNIDGWNTSSLTNLQQTFYGATNFNQPLNSWNTSNVTNMFNTFNFATNFNQPLNNWNVRKVNNFSNMFTNTNFNSSLSGWAPGADVVGTVDLLRMFQLAPAFNQDLSSWNTSNVTSMVGLFDTATSFNQDLSSWNTTKVISMSQMFLRTYAFNNAGSSGINNWNTSNVTSMASMFQSSSFNQPIGNWNTSNVTNMQYMFYYNTSFNQPIGSWNVSKVTTMSNMFANATAFNQDISSWNLAGLNINTGLDGFMTFKTGGYALSTANYDALLIGWNNNKLVGTNGVANWRTDLRPHFGGAKYTAGGAAATARAALVSYGWTITDGGTA